MKHHPIRGRHIKGAQIYGNNSSPLIAGHISSRRHGGCSHRRGGLRLHPTRTSQGTSHRRSLVGVHDQPCCIVRPCGDLVGYRRVRFCSFALKGCSTAAMRRPMSGRIWRIAPKATSFLWKEQGFVSTVHRTNLISSPFISRGPMPENRSPDRASSMSLSIRNHKRVCSLEQWASPALP